MSEALPAWSVAPMTADDLSEVLEIEAASQSIAWSRRIFMDELALPQAHLEVLRDQAGRICCYIDYWIVFEELHILNVVTARSARRRGCAAFLLGDVVARVEAAGALYMTLEVRVGNEAAQRLYQKLGLDVVGRRKRYYADTGEDALIMSMVLGDGVGGLAP